MVRNPVMKRKGGVGGCVGSGSYKWFLFNRGIRYAGIDLRLPIYLIKCTIICLHYIVVETIKERISEKLWEITSEDSWYKQVEIYISKYVIGPRTRLSEGWRNRNDALSLSCQLKTRVRIFWVDLIVDGSCRSKEKCLLIHVLCPYTFDVYYNKCSTCLTGDLFIKLEVGSLRINLKVIVIGICRKSKSKLFVKKW